MWKTVRMSQDGACPGDFVLQDVNCPRVKLGQEFPRVAFRGHIRSLPKLMEITRPSHASKSLWSCCSCSLAERIHWTIFFLAVWFLHCAAVWCVLSKYSCDCCWGNGHLLKWKHNRRREKVRGMLWFRTCLWRRDCIKHAAMVKVIFGCHLFCCIEVSNVVVLN